MKRIDERTVELSDVEMLVTELFDVLLDRGLGLPEALAWLCQDDIPSGLQTETPVLDAVLTPEFRTYLVR
jgi:hypothetical protein